MGDRLSVNNELRPQKGCHTYLLVPVQRDRSHAAFLSLRVRVCVCVWCVQMFREGIHGLSNG